MTDATALKMQTCCSMWYERQKRLWTLQNPFQYEIQPPKGSEVMAAKYCRRVHHNTSSWNDVVWAHSLFLQVYTIFQHLCSWIHQLLGVNNVVQSKATNSKLRPGIRFRAQVKNFTQARWQVRNRREQWMSKRCRNNGAGSDPLWAGIVHVCICLALFGGA